MQNTPFTLKMSALLKIAVVLQEEIRHYVRLLRAGQRGSVSTEASEQTT